MSEYVQSAAQPVPPTVDVGPSPKFIPAPYFSSDGYWPAWDRSFSYPQFNQFVLTSRDAPSYVNVSNRGQSYAFSARASLVNAATYVEPGLASSERGFIRKFVKKTEKRANDIEVLYLDSISSMRTWSPLEEGPDLGDLIFKSSSSGALWLDFAIPGLDDIEAYYAHEEVAHTVRLYTELQTLGCTVGVGYLLSNTLTRAIRAVLAWLHFPASRHSRVFIEREWFIYHGSHPPKLDLQKPLWLRSGLWEGVAPS
jgi:hypothetical protein